MRHALEATCGESPSLREAQSHPLPHASILIRFCPSYSTGAEAGEEHRALGIGGSPGAATHAEAEFAGDGDSTYERYASSDAAQCQSSPATAKSA